MAGFGDLAREYEARRFPPTRRLDLHGEGPRVAHDRALRWIQSFAHEEPGQELLLIVDRARGPRRAPSPVRVAVERLLRDLEGKLIDWWQVFGDGSLALRVSADPRMAAATAPIDGPADEGRTPETGGTVLIPVDEDIPEELLDLARRAAELRRTREGLSVGLSDILLRRIWIEAQAEAMSRRVTFASALQDIFSLERDRALEEE